MEKNTALRDIFNKYVQGQLNEEEVRAFLAHVQSGSDSEVLQEWIGEVLAAPVTPHILHDPKLKATLDVSWATLQDRVQATRRAYLWRRIVAAAAVLIGILAGGLWLLQYRNTPGADSTVQQQNISPGIQTATLTLADGRSIRLQEAGNGQLAREAGVDISKSADGQLIYEVKDNNMKTESKMYNTLSTANGETYKIRLPDGTQVWLNAASSVRYAVNFSAQTLRIVELKGEAYFEVAKNASKPFKVILPPSPSGKGGGEIEVLGTHFNINSYADEPAVRTTLLEGSVLVRHKEKSARLQPGEQSSLSASGNLKVNKVDTESVTAWVKNEFVFDGDDIESVMRKIARWYNVKVVYQGKKNTEKFSGNLSRFDRIGKALQLLEKTGVVHFRTEGRTVYVLP